ncbi:hypothetical protein PGT21_024000 [Puccinia graminis f. sp. tritici]|uniref:Uncharacterized protein n=1 Tax=Puccinia graminis f. sp. tritici TaxID=56615 RepID=A0A5B0LQN6_PUCGR|nr:hypothetical protein PGT21_024000 [Puccinia graminis f. sp. tritici]KAA1072650.1 hypothetical protein PGTUg99_009934 [Puccinia graminis f. sp. tritici]
MQIGIERLNTLSSVYEQLDALLSSPSPPQSIYVQSASNLDFTLEFRFQEYSQHGLTEQDDH